MFKARRLSKKNVWKQSLYSHKLETEMCGTANQAPCIFAKFQIWSLKCMKLEIRRHELQYVTETWLGRNCICYKTGKLYLRFFFFSLCIFLKGTTCLDQCLKCEECFMVWFWKFSLWPSSMKHVSFFPSPNHRNWLYVYHYTCTNMLWSGWFEHT
jgi:hypothetical protein